MVDDIEKEEFVLQGIAASPGVVHGHVFVLLQKELDIPIYEIEAAKHEEEIARFEKALLTTRHQVISLREQVAKGLGEDEAKIFDAHLLVLEDKALIEETIRLFGETGYNIEYAFRSVCQRFVEAFSALKDEYIKERVADIRDVGKRVLDNLLGKGRLKLADISAGRIIASEDIAPSDTVDLESSKLLGIITDTGSRTSHAVIMARSLMIPAVVGLHDATKRLENNDYVLIDGYEGSVYVNPSEDTLFRYGELQRERQSIQRIFRASVNRPAKTLDNKNLPIMANIEGIEDDEAIQESGCDGVGLFRTEALFIRRKNFPDEEEQFEVYSKAIRVFKQLPVTIRTLDLGGDKWTIGDFQIEDEENPFMGFRAIRFCLEHKDMFKEQLRAILRVSALGNVKIMYPMISGVSELVAANKILEEAKEELRVRGVPFNAEIPVGSMIEIPSAALTVDLLAPHCQFISIGTNDLIQYLLAVDRVNDRIAHLYEPNHPAVIRTISQIIQTAHKHKLHVSVCGEMAADPIYVPLLFGLGADDISVAVASMPEIKFFLRQFKLKDAQTLARRILHDAEPSRIIEKLEGFYLNHMEHILGE